MNKHSELYDIVIIGGGINGAGIAADAAGRGLKVALCDKGDLGGETSSASTKLIHGGLRYLETYEFRLVRKALKESELLLALAPHLIQPISINIPHTAYHRPWLLIRLGLFLYNHLARRPGYRNAKAVRFHQDSPLADEFSHGFNFWDGQVDDARLVILNAVQAARDSADILVRNECVGIKPADTFWEVTLEDRLHGEELTLKTRTIVNATGPWVSQLIEKTVNKKPRNEVRLVKGSHIIIPRIQPEDQAFLLQNEDGRIVFVIPYQQNYSLIGTTEEEFAGDPSSAEISTRETDYLIDVVNGYFHTPIKKEDVVYSYSGVRPLVGEEEQSATRASRDYRLEFENTPLPLLSIYGGKVTTYRILAEQAVDMLGKYIAGIEDSKTSRVRLPGGDIESREQQVEVLIGRHPWLEPGIIRRWVAAYGSLCSRVLQGSASVDDLGMDFGHGLFQREVDYLVESEWAITAEDILWRRTKLGLVFSESQKRVLDKYLGNP